MQRIIAGYTKEINACEKTKAQAQAAYDRLQTNIDALVTRQTPLYEAIGPIHFRGKDRTAEDHARYLQEGHIEATPEQVVIMQKLAALGQKMINLQQQQFEEETKLTDARRNKKHWEKFKENATRDLNDYIEAKRKRSERGNEDLYEMWKNTWKQTFTEKYGLR